MTVTFPEAKLEPDDRPPCLCDRRRMAREVWYFADRYAGQNGIEERGYRPDPVQVGEVESALRVMYDFRPARCCDGD